MQPVAFTWQETDPDRPAYDVMVRVVGLDSWYDDRDLAAFLLKRDAEGRWSGVVDLPDGLRSGYQFCPMRERRIQPSGMDDDSWADLLAMGTPDPSNPDIVGSVFGTGEPASILELPGALPQPWRTRRPAVAQGALHSFDTGREWPTVVHVYTPPTAAPGPMPVAVLFDGQAWIPADIAATFDNLIADGVVPPFVAAAVAYPFGPVRVRGLTRPDISLRYLSDELLPWLSRDFGTTTDPRQTVLIGQSLGGVAAVNAALAEPSRFGNVISQSGAFWWPGGSDGELSGAEVIAAAAAPGPVRFWLEAGAFETALIDGNRDLYAALREHGADVSYREYPGGHDFACWRGGVADGLVALLGGLSPIDTTG